MSRFYEGDGDSPEDYLYWPNVKRAVRGSRGQTQLREVIQALLSMKQRCLISGAILTPAGDVCAVGAYARYKGVDLRRQPEDFGLELTCWDGNQEETIELGVSSGLLKMIASHLGFLNDVDYGGEKTFRADGPMVVVETWDEYSDITGRIAHRSVNALGVLREYGFTPEERWQRIYDWCCGQVRWNLPVIDAADRPRGSA